MAETISTSGLFVEVLADGRTYRLARDYEVTLGGLRGVVPTGFLTDFASVPRPLWAIFPPFGRYSRAAVWHDYRYQFGGCSRAQADGEFLAIMKHLGVPRRQRWPMYLGVRAGGWWAWRRYARVRAWIAEHGGADG